MRNGFRLAISAAALMLVPSVASASTNIVSNGSFELPHISDSCCNTVPPDSLPDWNVGTGDINVVNGTYGGNGNLAFSGNQYLDLVGQSGQGSINQLINTIAGQAYTLTFAYSNNIFGGANLASADFGIGSLTGSITHDTATQSDLNWSVFTGTFTGTGEAMNLFFTNTSGSQNGSVFLDAVSIAALPEPSTWLMMILGFGLAGGMLRRRKQALALA